VLLPHILTSLRQRFGGRGVGDDAVPYLVVRSAMIVTMHTRIAGISASELGLNFGPPPVKLQDIQVYALWHAFYNRDPWAEL
jgi:hypothetical protein